MAIKKTTGALKSKKSVTKPKFAAKPKSVIKAKVPAPRLFVINRSVIFEHRNFLAVLALFVGFSLYSITSFMTANNNSIKKMFADVLNSGQAKVEQQVTQNPFSDLTADDPHYAAIIYLYNKGVIGGFPNNTFKPDNKVTRAEFAKMLIEATDTDYSAFPAANMSNCFADVTDVPADWFAPSVCAAKYEGYVQGADGQFAPNQNINKAEGLKIIMKGFGFVVPANEAVTVMPYTDVQPTDWFVGVAQSVKDNGVDSKSTIFSPSWELTRGDVAQLIFNAMKLKNLVK